MRYGHALGNAHHKAAHDEREQLLVALVGAFPPECAVKGTTMNASCRPHHGVSLRPSSSTFSLALSGGVGIAEKVHACPAPARAWPSSSRPQGSRCRRRAGSAARPFDADGQTARTRNRSRRERRRTSRASQRVRSGPGWCMSGTNIGNRLSPARRRRAG